MRSKCIHCGLMDSRPKFPLTIWVVAIVGLYFLRCTTWLHIPSLPDVTAPISGSGICGLQVLVF